MTYEYGAKVNNDQGHIYWQTREVAELMVRDYPGLFVLVAREVSEPHVVSIR